MELEKIESSLISHRGYDPATQTMQVRFVHKQFDLGPLYEYGNVSETMWENGCAWRNDNEKSEQFGDLSFGQWFQRFVKPYDKVHPFRKLEDARNVEQGTQNLFKQALKESVADFTGNGQIIPASEPEPLPEDIDELGAKALELQRRARAIIINSAEAYSIAETTGVAIVRMRAALETTLRPKIEEARKPYKALLDILNKYDEPLESDQKRLTAGMAAFKRAEDARIRQQADEERRRLQAIADEEARKRAEELKKADIQQAKDNGETELAQQIAAAPALPIQPAFVPPVQMPRSVPQTGSSYHVEKWEFEWVDARGQVIEHPDLNLIPREYLNVDERAIAAVVKRTKNRTNIPGVRAFDAGAVRLKKRGA